VQLNKDSEVAQLIRETNPYMVEESVWSANRTDVVVSFPVIPPVNSVFRHQALGIDLLEQVKLVQQSWVEYGTDESLCVDPTLRHNVSNTVTVPEGGWDQVEEYIFNNRAYFAGISLLGSTGDKDYNQAPMTEVLSEQEILEKYGRAALFASGLIVDTLNGFDNLWDATFIAQQSADIGDKEKIDARAEWIRRFRKFADNYFEGNAKKAEYCLKDVYLLHKWTKIQRKLNYVDFSSSLKAKKYIDVDTMGAEACAGGACEI
jgi:ribonucleoside-diphosphate reductase alpha chain